MARFPLLSVAALLALLSATVQADGGLRTLLADEDVDDEPPSWSYECGPDGPPSWTGNFNPGALEQSPVDVPVLEVEGTFDPPAAPLSFNYDETVKATVAPGGGMTVAVPAGQYSAVGDRKLELLQFHFHSPSEHAYNGVRWPMEVHLVHKDVATGQLVVIGVMMEDMGGASEGLPLLYHALKVVPETSEESPAELEIDLYSLLPEPVDGDWPYATYAGSLTTPPLSEDLTWINMRTPIGVSGRHMLKYMMWLGGGKTVGNNARPLQPHNGRSFGFQPENMSVGPMDA